MAVDGGRKHGGFGDGRRDDDSAAHRPVNAAVCFAQARTCEEAARRATYEAQRQQLLALADEWRALGRLAHRILPE